MSRIGATSFRSANSSAPPSGALVNRPQVLFLDEASSAMDEGLEHAMYQLLRDSLPNSVLISVGHRSTLLEFTRRNLRCFMKAMKSAAALERQLPPDA